MPDLPRTKWLPLLIPNPDRKWWQFWKPKLVWNPNNPVPAILTEHNEIMNDLPWKELHHD